MLLTSLFFIVTVSLIIVLFFSSNAFSDDLYPEDTVAVNMTTKKTYNDLYAAVQEANDSDIVQIIKEGTYVVDCFRNDFNVPNHITISADDSLDPNQVILDGICYEPEGLSDYPIFPAPKGVEFQNLTLDVGNHSYHGFWNLTQPIKYYNSIIRGWLWTSCDTLFQNCEFYQESSGYYCIYTYAGNILFDNCYFNAYGKFVNVYKEDCHNLTKIDFQNCKFESQLTNKSAINVKASDGFPLMDHSLNWDVQITGCSTIGENFPTDKRLGNPLVMIDDGNSTGIKISVADESGNPAVIYPPPPEYYTLIVGEERQLHTPLEADSIYETLLWESLTPEVVTVTQDGYIKQVKSGFSRIKATTSVTNIVAEFNVSFPCFIFHMNGHGEQIEDIYTEPYDPQRQIKLKPEDPVAEGFTFDGWYTDESLTNLYMWDEIQTSDLDLYAKWTKVPSPSHTVTFHPENGAPDTSVQVSDGEKVDRPQDPIWDDDHTFLFWTNNIEDDNNEPFDFNTEIHSDLDLYAAWTVTKVEVDVDVPEEIVIDEQSKAICGSMATEISLSLAEDIPSLPEGIVLDGNLEEQKEAFQELVEVVNTYKEDMENRELHVTMCPHAEDKDKQVPVQEISKFKNVCLPNVDFDTSIGLACVYNFGVDYTVKVTGDITKEKTVALSEISKPLKYEINNLSNKDSMWDGAIQVLRFHENEADDISDSSIADRVNQKIYIFADKFSTYLVDYSPDLFVYFNHNYEGAPVQKVICPYNTALTNIPVPERESYIFINWFKDEDCSEAFDFSQALVSQHTVYAGWVYAPSPGPEPDPPSPEPVNPENNNVNSVTGDCLGNIALLLTISLMFSFFAVIVLKKFKISL